MNELKYIGIVGRGNTVAIGALDNRNLNFYDNCTVSKIDADKYYEAMLAYVAEEIVNSLKLGNDTIIYTVDCVADAAKALADAVRNKKGALPDELMDSLLVKKTEGEKRALNALFQVLRLGNALKLIVKVEKAKEVDMLLLELPDGFEPEVNTSLNFTNGTANHGIRIQGWHNYNRKNAKVKVKLADGKKVFYIYKNDYSALGVAKGNMLRHLWSLAPAAERNKRIAG